MPASLSAAAAMANPSPRVVKAGKEIGGAWYQSVRSGPSAAYRTVLHP